MLYAGLIMSFWFVVVVFCVCLVLLLRNPVDYYRIQGRFFDWITMMWFRCETLWRNLWNK